MGGGGFAVVCVVLAVLMPWQVGLEEWLFRGYLMQGCGLWLGRRWAAVAVTGLAFGLLHGGNPEVARFGFWVAMPQYVVMGLVLGLVAVWDDGVELAFGLHLGNNVLSSVLVTHEAAALRTHALWVDTMPGMSENWDTLRASSTYFFRPC